MSDTRGWGEQWGSLMRLRHDFDRLFEAAMGGGTKRSEDIGAWWPTADILEKDDAYQVVAEVPGLSEDDIHLALQGKVLTISGEKKVHDRDECDGVHLVERVFGKFSRSFTLPSDVDPDGVDATFSCGVLTVSLPKAVKSKGRRIPIKSR